MATYETDEEQVEAIKKWWKENGIHVVLGIVLGLGLIVGWRWWQTYTTQEAQYASSLYEKVLFSLENEKIKEAEASTNQLLSHYSTSPYAILSVLNLAQQNLKEGNIEETHARLQWIIEQNSSVEILNHIARLRKAQLFLSQQKLADAKQLIEVGMQNSKFKKMYFELQGDIAIAQAQKEKARTAYTEALSNQDLAPQHKEWIQMKLDNLGKKENIQMTTHLSAFGHLDTIMETETLTVPISELATPNTVQEIVLESIPISKEDTPPFKIEIPSEIGNPSTTE